MLVFSHPTPPEVYIVVVVVVVCVWDTCVCTVWWRKGLRIGCEYTGVRVYIYVYGRNI